MSNPPFSGPGQIRGLLRSADWSKTPLGPLEGWPKSLVGYVEMVLAMPTPAIIFWGPEQTQIYNEGYAVIMGPRHPRYFGAPYRECWPDTRPTIQPFMDEVLAGGIAQFDRTLFTLTRHGFLEEAYFTFTFSALRDDGGAIAGIFQPVVEVTGAVLQERRAGTLRALSQPPASIEAAVRDAVAAFEADAADIPFSAIYLAAAPGLALAGCSKNVAGRELGPLAGLAAEVLEAGEPRLVDGLEGALGRAIEGPWCDATREAFLVPLSPSSPGGTPAVVVLGVSPRLRFDEPYRQFFESAARLFADARERAVLVEREGIARREAELQKEHLTRLFMQAPTPICVLRGPRHVIDLANGRMREVWRRRHDDLIGRPLLEAVGELAEQGFGALLDGVLATGQAYVGKEVVARVKGPNDESEREAYFNFVYEPLRGVDGQPEGVMVIAFDVTDDVRARGKLAELRDVAERENRSKDEFLAMLGHELRNPLAPLLAALHLVRSALPASPIDKQLSVIERQTHNLQRIVDDLLEVSRVTRGKIELRRERVDLASLAERALESTQGVLEARRHRLSVSLPERAPFVDADPVRVEQVLVNLLTNAAKYTDPGGQIELGIERAGSDVELYVRDNGVGIAADLRPRLFELFQQGDRDSARSQGGLGVGLTIVRRLVELHGGTIEVRSEGPGKGSEFRVRLPSAGDDAPAAPASPAPRSTGPHRVLIVDDNDDAAEMLAEVLEGMGHEARTAPDGPSALAAWRAWRPDVMFVDIGLPGMDGYQVAEQISAAEARPALLVALTGYGQESDRRKAREAGFDEHLVKPAQLASIERLLERVPPRA